MILRSKLRNLRYPTVARAAHCLVATALLVGIAHTARAADTQAAAEFVQTVSNHAIQILREPATDAQRESAFQQLMAQNVDLPRVARFTLAKYWRQASEQQRQEFQRLFDVYMVHVYSSRLGQYSGETVKITGATPENQNQVVVHSQITRAQGEPVDVDWRVRQDEHGMKLVDLVVAGVSMAITQRSEFSAVIDNNGGNIDALLQRMRQAIDQRPV